MECDWQSVETDADVDDLLGRFGGFHDGCLREVHFWTGTWVDEDRTMNFSQEPGTHVRILFQRQWPAPSAIELLFDEVAGFHLSPAARSDIDEAALFIIEGTVYWADWYDWRPDSNNLGRTWIAAKKLRWREANQWMGSQLRYSPGSEE